jgi:hypothetical protein
LEQLAKCSFGFGAFCERLVITARSEHTVINLIKPPDDPEALQPARAVVGGLPRRGVMNLARSQGLPVRLYVPFGQAWLPYALGQVLRKPALWPRLLKDSLTEAWQTGT